MCEVDLLICIDSNRKFIDYRKLWTLKGSKRIPCSTVKKLKDIVQNTNIQALNHILIGTGCIDLDDNEPAEVAEEMRLVVGMLKTKFPGIKVVLCEITQRNDDRDEYVKQYNYLFKDYSRMSKMFLSRNIRIYVMIITPNYMMPSTYIGGLLLCMLLTLR